MTANQGNVNDQRGSAEQAAEPRFLVIGQITKPHGVRGEVRVHSHTDDPVRFTWLETVYVGDDVDPQPVSVEGVRFHKKMVLLKLAGIDDRNEAGKLRGLWVQVPEEEAVPLEEDEFFLFQLIGLQVYEEEGGHLGELTQVIETGANYVFVVTGEAGEVLLPDIDDVVQEIDFENGRMLVTLLPGLLP